MVCRRMAKRKQARPSRPGISTALTSDNVFDGHVEIEANGEVAAVLEDAEDIPGVLNGVEQASSHKRRRLGTSLHGVFMYSTNCEQLTSVQNCSAMFL